MEGKLVQEATEGWAVRVQGTGVHESGSDEGESDRQSSESAAAVTSMKNNESIHRTVQNETAQEKLLHIISKERLLFRAFTLS